MKQPWRRKVIAPLGLLASVLTLTALPSDVHAQNGGGNKQFLLNNWLRSDGQWVPRRGPRPFVPFREKPDVKSPSQTFVWRNRLKRYPDYDASFEAYVKALQHRDSMVPARMRGSLSKARVPSTGRTLNGAGRQNIATSTNRSWIPTGPYDLTPHPELSAVQGSMKVAGRANAVALDSRGNAYVATAGGGLWRFPTNPRFDPDSWFDLLNPRLNVLAPTDPLGASPIPLSDSSFSTLQTSSVAVDPKNDRIIYVGLGDYPTAGRDVVGDDGVFGSRRSNNVDYSLGMMKSVNSGRTWANIGNGRLFAPLKADTTTGQPGTTFQSRSGSLSTFDGDYVGARVTITDGSLAGQTRIVTGYVGNINRNNPGQPVIHQITVGAAFPNNTDTPLPDSVPFDLQPNILEGTAVSSILIDPEDSQHIVVTSGRGTAPGRIWVSRDGGNTFIKGRTVVNGEVVLMPIADYSNVDVSVRDARGNRVYYCAVVGDGVYRSFDGGDNWSKLNVPLVFNDPNRGGVPNGNLELGLKVAAGRRADGAGVLYVFDAAGGFADGRILKSLNANLVGTQPGWTDITGNYPREEGAGNVFNFANYDTTLGVGLVRTPVVDASGTPTNDNVFQEVLFGGINYWSTSLGAVPYSGGFLGSTATGDPILRQDTGAGQDWAGAGNGMSTGQTHIFQHGILPDNISPFLGFVVNDGGLYQYRYESGTFQLPATVGDLPTFNNATFSFDPVDPDQEPNRFFPIAEFYRADFIETTAGTASNNVVRVAGAMASNGFVNGVIDFSGTDPLFSWTGAFNLSGAQVTDAFGSGIRDFANVVFDANGNALNDPDDIRFDGAVDPVISNEADLEIEHIRFDPSDPTGNTQYLITTGTPSTPWGNPNGIPTQGWKAIYMTTDGWNTYQNITPNRYRIGGNPRFFSPTRFPNPFYVYNATAPADGGTQGNWTGEAKPWYGMAMAFGFAPRVVGQITRTNEFIPNNADPPRPTANEPGTVSGPTDQPVMYTGGQFLWRFDPPGSLAKPHFPPGPLGRTADPAAPAAPYTYANRVFPNEDYGAWRRVSPQLASGTNYITAIAIDPNVSNNRVYVGTSDGSVWICSALTALDGASVQNDYIATSLATDPVNWRQIAGPGLTGNTLPARPVTSISINPDPPATQLGDIIVTLGGAPQVPHVWRSTNTTGAQVPIFTAVSGQGFASLPDVPVNDLVRDPDDSTNTLYVATDLGVFTSIDGGATWSNATAPLGLPNVECTSIKVLPATPNPSGTRLPRQLYVATMGRGIWRFDLNELEVNQARPNLKIAQNFTRNGNEIIVNVIITNAKDGTNPVGTAFDVKLSEATITAGSAVTNSTSFFGGPINVGTIAPGQSQVVTVRFPATAGRRGQAVFFRANGTLTLPPFPPGTTATFDNGPGFRTRLP